MADKGKGKATDDDIPGVGQPRLPAAQTETTAIDGTSEQPAASTATAAGGLRPLPGPPGAIIQFRRAGHGGGGGSGHGGFSQSAPMMMLQQPLGNQGSPRAAPTAGAGDGDPAARVSSATVTSVGLPDASSLTWHGGLAPPLGNPVTIQSLVTASLHRFLARRRQQGNASAPQGHRGQSSSVPPEQQSSSPAAGMCLMCLPNPMGLREPIDSNEPQGAVPTLCEDCDGFLGYLIQELLATEPQGAVPIDEQQSWSWRALPTPTILANPAYTGDGEPSTSHAPAAYATRPPFLPALGHGGGGNPADGVTIQSLRAASIRRFLARRQHRNASAPQGQLDPHRGQSSSVAPEQQSSSGGVYVDGVFYDKAALEQHQAIRAKLLVELEMAAIHTKDRQRGGPPPPPPPPPPPGALC